MLEYAQQSSKGHKMEVVSSNHAWENSKDIYEMIYKVFPDKNQADGVASIFEKVIGHMDISAQRMVNEKVFFIIEKVREELDSRNFATKSDLEAGLAKLELKLTNKINELKLELKQDIADVKLELKQDIAEVRTEIAEVKSELKQDIADVELRLTRKIAEVRTELKQDIAGVKSELKQDIAEVKADIKGLSAFNKIIVGALITILVGIIAQFFVK